MALQCEKGRDKVNVLIKLLLGLVELLSEEATCDVYYRIWPDSANRYCRRLRATVGHVND
jgi:hypothetical protein